MPTPQLWPSSASTATNLLPPSLPPTRPKDCPAPHFSPPPSLLQAVKGVNYRIELLLTCEAGEIWDNGAMTVSFIGEALAPGAGKPVEVTFIGPATALPMPVMAPAECPTPDNYTIGEYGRRLARLCLPGCCKLPLTWHGCLDLLFTTELA